MDFVGPLSITTKHYQYLIVTIDYLSKWYEAIVMKRYIQEVIANFMFQEVVCRYKYLLEIMIYRASYFICKLLSNLLQKMSIKYRRANSYYLNSNRLIERTIVIIYNIIVKEILEKWKLWNTYINEAFWTFKITH